MTSGTTIDLSKYDYEILIDKSGSMEKADCPGGKSRFEYAQEQAEALARTCEKFDSDGITVVPFNGHFKVYENTTADRVEQVFMENKPQGSTATGAVVEDRLFGRAGYFARKAAGSAKPLILVIITDGEATDPELLEKVIVNAANKVESDEELGISFFQVGRDATAHKFLKKLDDDLQSHGAKFDIVNVKTYDELEDVSITEALIAALTE